MLMKLTPSYINSDEFIQGLPLGVFSDLLCFGILTLPYCKEVSKEKNNLFKMTLISEIDSQAIMLTKAFQNIFFFILCKY